MYSFWEKDTQKFEVRDLHKFEQACQGVEVSLRTPFSRDLMEKQFPVKPCSLLQLG